MIPVPAIHPIQVQTGSGFPERKPLPVLSIPAPVSFDRPSPVKYKSGNTAYKNNYNRIGFPFPQYKQHG